MKKRLITISIIICLFATTTIVYAANTATVNATISGLKMYFNGNQLKGDVMTVKGVTYVPADILNNNLGFKLSTDSKANNLTITEKVSKNKLLNDIITLQSQIGDLNEKLKKYRGDVPSDSEYKSIFSNIAFDGKETTNIYNQYWNKATQFRVGGKIYDSNTVGIQFTNLSTTNSIPFFNIDNSGLNYSKLKFSYAIDDLGQTYSYTKGSTIVILGNSKILGTKTLYNSVLLRDLSVKTEEVNISGYETIVFCVVPPVKGTFSLGYSVNKPSIATSSGEMNAYEDYILVMNPQIK